MVGPKTADPHTRITLPTEFRLPKGYKPKSGHSGHQKSFTSTRTALHRGHRIKIKTTYRIEIDDDPVTVHTMVMDDGSVHCHGLPNYSFPSVIDLVKSIIDTARLASPGLDEIGDGNDNDQHDGGEQESHNARDGEDL